MEKAVLLTLFYELSFAPCKRGTMGILENILRLHGKVEEKIKECENASNTIL
ncbi:MAG: hypothetical protein NC902_03630 [Candidatus Omnitrophica bacterium]|nr:hypothetical protein [Candidatus Omnitrophota bacterium]